MDQRPKQPQPIKPPVRQPSLPPDMLWEGHMEHYSQLVKRSKRKEGSKPLAPPQGTNEIPGIRIAFETESSTTADIYNNALFPLYIVLHNMRYLSHILRKNNVISPV